MIKFALRTVAVAFIALSTAGLASAEQYTLNNVTLTLGVGGAADGTLTGTFTTDATNHVISYDIVASHNNGSPPVGGFTYTLGVPGVSDDSSVVASSLPSSYFEIWSTGGTNQLELVFTGGLTMSGGTLSGGSFEYETILGTRDVATGTVTAVGAGPASVPEPTSIALMSSALAIALGGAWVRRRRAVAG